MSMTALRTVAEKNLELLNQFKKLMEETKTDLEGEQADSEEARAEWDEESGDPEPDEVDNQNEIDLLDNQLVDLEEVISGFEQIVGALR
jgi:Sec-independent protein translocase protein TatA